MTAPHDRPTAAELVGSVREWLERDLAPNVDGRLAFHTRVAVNSLDIVLREMAAGDSMALRHGAVLESLGVTDDRELAEAVRRGDHDADLRTLLEALAPVVEDKVRVANPRYLVDPRDGLGDTVTG